VRDQRKTKAQLIQELNEVRQRLTRLEEAVVQHEDSQTALEEQRQRLFGLLDALPAVVYLQSPDYSIPFANRLFREIHGEPKGRPCYAVLHAREAPCEECHTFGVFETGESQVRESIGPGAGPMYQVHEYPFTDVDGSTLVLVLATDISALKHADEALQRLMEFNESIVRSMGDGVVVLDERGDITFTNPTADLLLGYQAEELVGHHWTRIVPQDQQPVLQEAEQGTTSSVRDRFELDVKRKDGTRVPVLISSSPRFGNALLAGTLWVFTDIAERKRAEKALKEYSARLEEMVDERTRELQDAQAELVSKERLAILGELAAGVSHELRNPLATITNAVYFLQMTLTDADDTTKEYLQLIAAQVQSAGKIVSDLLDFSRDSAADRQSTPLPQLVAQLWERCVPPENVEVATILPPGLPPVFVDPHQLGQVLENLVTNAYQAMPKGGDLTIEATAGDDEVYLSIADTGVGIATENMDRLFEPLFSTKPRGIGLGLAVSRRLVEANGGSIKVESEEGKGSTFTLVLPAAHGQD